jgi:hypothetical protein
MLLLSLSWAFLFVTIIFVFIYKPAVSILERIRGENKGRTEQKVDGKKAYKEHSTLAQIGK